MLNNNFIVQEKPQFSSGDLDTKNYLWLLFKRFFVAMIILSITWLFIASSNAQISADNMQGKNESGHLEMKTVSGKRFSAIHLNTEVRMQINGMVAEVSYIQQFENNSKEWAEATYLFPLPETAAVSAMEIRLNDRIIKGTIQEKQAARQIYQQAKARGQVASLVEQQRANMFTQKIANIPPGETIQVSLNYFQKVTYSQGAFELRLPLTITPRYIPGTPITNNAEILLGDEGWGWSQATDQVTDAGFITPHMINAGITQKEQVRSIKNPVSISIELEAGLPLASIESPYHQITVDNQQPHHSIKLTQGSVAMDRDFVLKWRSAASQAPSAALFNETIENEAYVMLMLLPPQQQQHPSSIAREIIFIIDTSGSMEGGSMEQAKSSLQVGLQTLRPTDRFNIIEFNSVYSKFSSTSVLADMDGLQQAQKFVAHLQAGGGTEIYAPLNAALTQPSHAEYLKQIVFITDGSIGNEQALLSLIHQNLASARLFTVGIGSAPNSFFMRKAAEFGRGTFTYVGHNAEVNEKMSALFNQLKSPLLQDIKITWPSDLNIEMWPERLPDLYEGQPLLFTAKLAASSTLDITDLSSNIKVTGKTSASDWEQSLSLQLPKTQHNGIAKLWARDKISALLDKKTAGTNESIIKPQVLNVALAHQLMSPYTSFIAVEERISRPQQADISTHEIPNLVAKNQTLMLHTYPQGALGLSWNLLIASLAIFATLVLYSWRPTGANS